MAKANGRPRGRPPHKNGKAAPSEPGDEQGACTHAELIRMNNRFRTRLLRAFKRGKENRQAAAAMYDVKPVAPVRSASHVIARATSWATRCTRPSPRSLPLNSTASGSRKACLKSNGTMRAACKTSRSWESVNRIGH